MRTLGHEAAGHPRVRGVAVRLRIRIAEPGIAGGAVYDALVGAVAVEHGLPLVTRDDRAIDVYRALRVELFAP